MAVTAANATEKRSPPSLLYALLSRLFPLLQQVCVGANLAILQIFFALVSGCFFTNRGALAPALVDFGLSQ